MSRVVLCAYPVKWNILTKNRGTKILANMLCCILSDPCNEIKNTAQECVS